MAYSDRTYGFSFMLTPMVKRLMIANVAVFFVTLIIGQGNVFDWFAFQPTRIFVRPWGPITYMFLHGGLMHLALNMLILFFFGPPLEGRWGEREFLRFYAICGLGGVALSYLFLPNMVIGASAAIYGLMLAFAMNWPNAPIYVWGIFPVKAKYLVGFFFLLSLLSALPSAGGAQAGGGTAHFAHLGGLIAGFLYLKSDWLSRSQWGRMKKAAARSRRLAIVPGDESGDEQSAEGQRREDAVLYDQVDEVLDKISATGMSSLTADELKLLDEVSKRHRTN
ncbi:MAG: rhomboid family intramembrane serine protease [Gemmatimonadota bacterium]|nr:rhomboid family intramembrane serine protease [Gemmatimonadota bacterium]